MYGFFFKVSYLLHDACFSFGKSSLPLELVFDEVEADFNSASSLFSIGQEFSWQLANQFLEIFASNTNCPAGTETRSYNSILNANILIRGHFADA